MVKCPRGTTSQIKANLINLKKWEKNISEETNIISNDGGGGGEEEETTEFSEEFEIDSNKADKRRVTNSRDQLVNFFTSYMLDTLLESWRGKPCYRPKLTEPIESTPSLSEIYGENDLLPCEYLSNLSTPAEYISDLYKKRSTTLERQNEYSKTKSVSDTNDSLGFEENAEEGFGEPETKDQWKAEPDEEVELVFLNGARYKGRVSRRLMDGEGTYSWEDGTSYTGEFIEGSATGKGRIEFPSLSVYEGGVYKGFRHGEGMHCLYDSPVMYTGQWWVRWLGKKHGEGLMVYSEPSKGHNFYRGQWQDGVQEGFGYRQYPSGAKYIGFWSNGKKHGQGVMLWSNNDIYRGEWKEGTMHGYGEYTWNGFVNKTLSYPATNTYRGFWSDGKRNGRGTFETINDGVIETVWENDLKCGPGRVICANGTVIAAERLFRKDRQAPNNPEDDAPGLCLKDRTRQKRASSDKNERNISAYLTNVVKGKNISIPIHSSIGSINLSHQIRKYNEKKERVLETELKLHPPFPSVKSVQSVRSPVNEFCCRIRNSSRDEMVNGFAEVIAEEEKYLRQAVMSKIAKLKVVYNAYATITCDNPPPFKCLLLRLFLWQMLIDCNIPDENRSLVDIDLLLAGEEYLLVRNPHDPFECIRFGQFVLILLCLSWNLYARHLFSKNPLVHEERVAVFLDAYQKSDFKYVLKMSFDYFIEKDVFFGWSKGAAAKGENRFLETDLAPLEAIYAIYRGLGEPHSTRDFLEKMLSLKKNSTNDLAIPELVANKGHLPSHILGGKNALTVAGKLAYIPGPTPFNFPEIIDKEPRTEGECSWLFCTGLSVRKVVDCLIRSCPGMSVGKDIVRMTHKLTFLEFYNAIVFCTELSLKLNKMKIIKRDLIEEHKRKMAEYEKLLSERDKLKDNRAVSTKRSRQVMDASKTVKK